MSDLKRLGSAGESRFGAVYEFSDGTFRAQSNTNFPGCIMNRCPYCARWIDTRECSGCWEVTSRLIDFVKTDEGHKFVIGVLNDVAAWKKREGK